MSAGDVRDGRARAVEAGHEKSGEPLYVIQSPLAEGVHPGKVALGGEYPGARVPYGGGEREVEVGAGCREKMGNLLTAIRPRTGI